MPCSCKYGFAIQPPRYRLTVLFALRVLTDNFCWKLFQFSTPTEIIKQYEIISPLITHQSEPQVCGLAVVTEHQDSGHIYSFILIAYLMTTLVTVGTSFQWYSSEGIQICLGFWLKELFHGTTGHLKLAVQLAFLQPTFHTASWE